MAAFARPPLIAFEAQTASLGKPGKSILQAMLLFEALKAHGVRYLADSNTPYTQVSANREIVDHIQYPAQTLISKAGDCDDLTVLYASLLENAGIATALVDYPGHIFLLFDTGIGRQESYKLPLENKRYVVYGDRLWIPVEVTRVDRSFEAAWRAGLAELAKLPALEEERDAYEVEARELRHRLAYTPSTELSQLGLVLTMEAARTRAESQVAWCVRTLSWLRGLTQAAGSPELSTNDVRLRAAAESSARDARLPAAGE